MGITSTEMVQPSSPTPPHLNSLKLSVLDRMTPPIYIPVIFFYKSYHQHSLKKSLPVVLAEFYPLAGRFSREKSTLDCNDLGALFVECKVEGNLSEAIKDPTMDELQKYLPPVGKSYGEATDVVLAIQINLFDCGGVAVAVQMNHSVSDANSLVCFMNAWAAASRFPPRDLKISPTFNMATLFPPKADMLISSAGSDSPEPHTIPPMTEKIVTKRLFFDKKDLENLKLRASKVIEDPTRVEAVTSFFLKHFRDASRARGSKKQLAVVHMVNMRPRMDPPLPSHAFGNAVSSAVGLLPVDGGDEGDFADIVRNAIREIDGDFVKEIPDGEGFSNALEKFNEVCLKDEPCFFSSWTRFPLYEVDYGWGKPVWVCTTSFPCKNTVILMSTSCGEGMEAWVNILEDDDAFIDFSL